MTQQIRTKWHKVLPLIEANEVYLTAVRGQMAQHWSKFEPNVKLTKQLIDTLAGLPKFVIADQLLPLTTQDNFQQSLLDMKKAGVLHLPYPAMIVEFTVNPTSKTRAIVLLRDTQADGLFSWEPGRPLKDSPAENASDEDVFDYDFYGHVFSH